MTGGEVTVHEVPLAVHRGSNQSGMRDFNERLVLSLLRTHGSLAKAEIARATGLSAQTVSVIMRQLEAEELLLRGEPVRGRVGQPSVPMSLNPQGAFFLGVKIGRRSTELVLIDFLGHALMKREITYAFPTPDKVVGFVESGINASLMHLGPLRSRVAGLGIAVPFELWNWATEIGATTNEMDSWRSFDIRASFEALGDWPVYLQNDATAACGAELTFGRHSGLQDFIYFYIGTFVGGGVVLNGSLYSGRTANAGALGSMPVPGPSGTIIQLIDQASLVVLERQLKRAELDPSAIWSGNGNWTEIMEHAEAWLDSAARGIAHAITAAQSVIDFEAALIDGGFPPGIRSRLVERIRIALHNHDLKGLEVPSVLEGSIGSVARALGGASLPLSVRFLIDQNRLMREPA